MMSLFSPVLRPLTRRDLSQTEWLGELLVSARAQLVSIARHEGLTPEESLDALHDAVETFLSRSNWRATRDAPTATALLATLVRNEARNARRRHARRDLTLEAAPEALEVDAELTTLETALDDARAHVRLTGCLSTLRHTQKAIVTARFFSGASGLDIAKELGLTPGHVAVLLHRANQSLRVCLQTSRKRFDVD